ncbi:hypothetical protein PR048_030496, partial [Dryococelus australis]
MSKFVIQSEVILALMQQHYKANHKSRQDHSAEIASSITITVAYRVEHIVRNVSHSVSLAQYFNSTQISTSQTLARIANAVHAEHTSRLCMTHLPSRHLKYPKRSLSLEHAQPHHTESSPQLSAASRVTGLYNGELAETPSHGDNPVTSLIVLRDTGVEKRVYVAAPETGYSRENPPTSGFVRHSSPMRKSGNLPDPARVGSQDLPDPARVGSQDLPDPARVGSQDLPDPARVGSQDLPDPARVGSQDLPDPARVGSQDLPDPARVGSQDLPDPARVGSQAEAKSKTPGINLTSGRSLWVPWLGGMEERRMKGNGDENQRGRKVRGHSAVFRRNEIFTCFLHGKKIMCLGNFDPEAGPISSRRTTRLPPRQTGSRSRIFTSGNRDRRCRWSAGFLGDLPSPPPQPCSPLLLHTHLNTPASALKISMLRAAQIFPRSTSFELPVMPALQIHEHLRVQGQEARERYGRQLHARLAPHRSYAQGVQCFRRNAVLYQLDLTLDYRDTRIRANNDFTENVSVHRADEGETRKPRRPAASYGTIATCENAGVTQPGIESGAPWWEASGLTTQPPRPQVVYVFRIVRVSEFPLHIVRARSGDQDGYVLRRNSCAETYRFPATNKTPPHHMLTSP